MVTFLTGSLGEFLDRHYESEKVKTLFLANNVYGKHGGPYQPGTALGLLFHLLSGGEHELQGFYGHVLGGMGAITQAMAAAAREFGAEIRTSAPVAKDRGPERAGPRRGARGRHGDRGARRRLQRRPEAHLPRLVERDGAPAGVPSGDRGIKMDGPVRQGQPGAVGGAAGERHAARSSRRPSARSSRSCPRSSSRERCYDTARTGEVPEELWVDCVVASNVDATLAPAGPPRDDVLRAVRAVPAAGGRPGTPCVRPWATACCARSAEYAPNVPASVVARQVLTPLDLERVYGLTEGNIFHGDLSLEQLFFLRPVAGWAHYRTPVEGLYLCGAGAHPGGGVTGAPGHNAAQEILKDWKRGRPRPRWASRERAASADRGLRHPGRRA